MAPRLLQILDPATLRPVCRSCLSQGRVLDEFRPPWLLELDDLLIAYGDLRDHLAEHGDTHAIDLLMRTHVAAVKVAAGRTL